MTTTNANSGSHYVHGYTSEEQARLSRLNDWLNAACLRELRLDGERRVLDVGSGLGHFAREIAGGLGPDALVVCVESDERQLDAAREFEDVAPGAGRVEHRHGPAEDPPLEDAEWGSFDLVHTRFLLEHVHSPEQVVQHLVKAARPGGRIVLADDDHDLLRLWPAAPRVSALWQAYIRLFDHYSYDPFVGRRLVSLLAGAGAEPRRNDWVFFGGCAGDARFDVVVANFGAVLEGAREGLVSAQLATHAEVDAAVGDLEEWGQRPDAALWYAMAWAEGVRV